MSSECAFVAAKYAGYFKSYPGAREGLNLVAEVVGAKVGAHVTYPKLERMRSIVIGAHVNHRKLLIKSVPGSTLSVVPVFRKSV